MSAIGRVETEKVDNLVNALKKKMYDMNEVHVIKMVEARKCTSYCRGLHKTFALYGTNLKMNCLSDNSCFLTAASNDLTFQRFELLIGSRITRGDVIIMLSGGGNSMSDLKVQERQKGNITIASITGYDGGVLSEISDISINIPVDDMEMAEDAQIIIMHYIKQRLCELLSQDRKALRMDKYERELERV